MTTVLAWLGVIIGAVVGALVAMTLLGSLLPRRHLVARTLLLPVPVRDVWNSIADFPGQPSWRRGLTAVERLPDQDRHEVWRETMGQHAIAFRTTESVAPNRLERVIVEENGPFQGRWEFRLESVVSPASSRLTLVERGEVAHPWFRFVNRFVIGQATTLEGYLKDLAAKFGVEPRFIPAMETQREVDAPPA